MHAQTENENNVFSKHYKGKPAFKKGVCLHECMPRAPCMYEYTSTQHQQQVEATTPTTKIATNYIKQTEATIWHHATPMTPTVTGILRLTLGCRRVMRVIYTFHAFYIHAPLYAACLNAG